MSSRKHKISAFTITELLVVMAISAIVVSLAFSVIGLLQRNAQNIQNNYKGKIDLRLLEQQLALDLQKYPEVRVDTFKENMIFSSPIDSIFYQFEEEYILREKDTFHLRIHQKTFYFMGKITTKGETDAIKMSFSEKTKQSAIFLFKRNDALNRSRYGN